MRCEKSDRTNLCVETKGVCFFCFHEISSTCNKPDQSHQLASYNISLRRLSKYLNLNFRKALKLNIPLQCANLNKSDVIVPLCGKCTFMARRFSRLHFELEMVKMHMDNCIKSIREKMVTADSTPTLTMKYLKRWKMNDPVDAIQAGIVNNLRRETKEKCLTKMTKMLPRVYLEKIRTATLQTETLKQKATPVGNGTQKSSAVTASKSSNLKPHGAAVTHENHDRTLRLEPNQASQPGVDVTLAVTDQELRRSPLIVPTSAVIQLPYRNTVASKSSSGMNLVSTTTSRTGEGTSSTSKSLPTFTTSQIPSRVSSNTQTTASSVEAMPASSVPPLLHIRDAVECPTRKSQRTTRPPRQTAEYIGSGAESSYDCVYCEEAFSDKSTLRIHVVSKHCEHFFTTLKDRNLSSEEFKSIVHLLFKDVAKSHTVSNGSLSKISYSCPQCHTTHESDGDVYAHMFRFHYTDLTSKLLDLQKQAIIKGRLDNDMKSNEPNQQNDTIGKLQNKSLSSFPCSCGAHYTSKRTLYFHQKYSCRLKSSKPNETEKTMTPMTSASTCIPAPVPVPTSSSSNKTAASAFNCAYCPKTFPFHYDHRVHLLTCHPMDEFSKYAVPGVTLEQVHTELQRILQTYRKIPGNDAAGGCIFCSQIFSQVIELQHHILVGHFDVVVFKLRGIVPQNNSTCRQSNSASITRSDVVVSTGISTTLNPTSEAIPDQGSVVVSVSTPSLKQDTGSLPTASNSVESMEIVVQDPLSLDSFELDPNIVLCQEEEQLKMEWLFSFIDEDDFVMEAQTSQIVGEEKAFVLEDIIDSEQILP